MIRDCKVLLIRVPRNDEGKVVTGGVYNAVIAIKEEVLTDDKKVIHREWVQVSPFITMSTDYEELFRARLAQELCKWIKFGITVGKFKFNILDKLLSGKDYDIPIEHLQALCEKIK